MKNKNQSVARAAVVVAFLTVISKILGFGREALIASFFGASAQTDAYFFAHSMPEMVFPSVCNSISTAFISLYVAKLTKDKIEGNRYASRMLTQSTIIGVCLAIIGVFLSSILVRLFAPGFGEDQIILASKLTKITMAAFVLIMIQYMMTAVLNSNKIFISSQISGLLYNIFIISVTFALHGNQSMEELTLTVVGGSIILVISLFAFSKVFRVDISYTRSYKKGELSELLKLALPIMLGNAVIQINSIVDKVIGSLLPEGSVSALSYSTTLCGIVTGVFIVSLSTVLYPMLSHDAANNDGTGLINKINNSITGLVVILIPVSIITILDSKTIVSFVYGRGNFDSTAINYTAFSLMFYGPMFMFYGIREVVSRSFFALKDSKTPMINTSIGVGLNIVFSIIFTKFLGIGGIALGTSVSTAITAFLFLYNANKKIDGFSFNETIKKFLRTVIPTFLAIVFMLALKYFTNLSGLLSLVVDTFVCFLVFFLLLSLFYREAVSIILKLLVKRRK